MPAFSLEDLGHKSRLGWHSIDVKIVTNMTVAAIFPGLWREREKKYLFSHSRRVEKNGVAECKHFSREPRGKTQVRTKGTQMKQDRKSISSFLPSHIP